MKRLMGAGTGWITAGADTCRRAWRPGHRQVALWLSTVVLGLAASLATAARPMPALADGLTIAIGSPLTDCPTLAPCYLPPTATVAAGATVTWVNKAVVGLHTATADNGLFDTGDIAPGASASVKIPITTPGGTYGYHDTYSGSPPTVKGSLTITAAPTAPPGSSSGGSGPGIAGATPDATVHPGQHLGQVSGAAAAKPVIVAAKTPAPVFGPGTLGQRGDTSLPPIDAAATPDAGTLPPISSPPPPRPRTLASAPAADNGGGGRSGAFYLVGALLFALVGAGAGGFYGVRWWRRRGAAGPPSKVSTA